MKSQLIRIENLQPSDRHDLYTLLQTHFEGVQPDVFKADLDQKNWAILLRDADTNTLKGFSTLLLHHTEFAGEPLSVIYSGDTITDPSAWSSAALPRTWLAAIKYLQQRYVVGKLYWLLICSGYRTYRFLPVFAQEFCPRYDTPMADDCLARMNFLAKRYYHSAYDKTSGIVRLSHPQILREGLRSIPVGRQSDRHIRFFMDKNPGHLQGDELVCFTEICEANLTRAGQRIWCAEPFLLVE